MNERTAGNKRTKGRKMNERTYELTNERTNKTNE